MNGAPFCDWCLLPVAGFGVIYGVIVTEQSPSGDLNEYLFCYNPATTSHGSALAGMVVYTDPGVCALCGIPVAGYADGVCVTDIDPDDPTGTRRLWFSYTNECRNLLLAGRVNS